MTKIQLDCLVSTITNVLFIFPEMSRSSWRFSTLGIVRS